MSDSEDYTGDVGTVIREMAHLSIMNDKINPVQEKNLKMFPFVFFDAITTAEIRYNLSGKNRIEVEEDERTLDVKYSFKKPETNGLKITYDLTLDESQQNHLEKRFEALKNAITTLLWSDMTIEVKFNGKSVYVSKT